MPCRVILLALAPLVGIAFPPGPANLRPSQQSDAEFRLRMTADSGTIGSYKFTARERTRLAFDIPDDDPRAAALSSLTGERQRTTELAVTLASPQQPPDGERRYLVYWLGYRISGDEVRGLSPLQWDSIFQEVGRRAAVRFTPLGELTGVELSSDAVRPVAQAFTEIVSSMGFDLPAEPVGPGDRWMGRALIPVTAPDGSRGRVGVEITYRLAEILVDERGPRARIEFDGKPTGLAAGDGQVTGEYYGECVFAIPSGRFDQMMAIANLEVTWEDSGTGLPPSQSLVHWNGSFTRN